MDFDINTHTKAWYVCTDARTHTLAHTDTDLRDECTCCVVRAEGLPPDALVLRGCRCGCGRALFCCNLLARACELLPSAAASMLFSCELSIAGC